jgi:hypothetical protein
MQANETFMPIPSLYMGRKERRFKEADSLHFSF